MLAGNLSRLNSIAAALYTSSQSLSLWLTDGVSAHRPFRIEESASGLPFCSAPDGDQHCNEHDSSGGMRNSGYDVDDAGDASNTEIGHVAYLPYRTSIAITPRARSCQIWELPRGN